MLVAGRSNKEIGSALGIEERTVKAHVAKADAKSRGPEPHRSFGSRHHAFTGYSEIVTGS